MPLKCLTEEKNLLLWAFNQKIHEFQKSAQVALVFKNIAIYVQLNLKQKKIGPINKNKNQKSYLKKNFEVLESYAG